MNQIKIDSTFSLNERNLFVFKGKSCAKSDKEMILDPELSNEIVNSFKKDGKLGKSRNISDYLVAANLLIFLV